MKQYLTYLFSLLHTNGSDWAYHIVLLAMGGVNVVLTFLFIIALLEWTKHKK